MDSAKQSRADAADTLAGIDRAARAGRLDAAAVWFPLLLFGAATLAGPTATDLIGGPAADAWYWGVTGPAIGQ